MKSNQTGLITSGIVITHSRGNLSQKEGKPFIRLNVQVADGDSFQNISVIYNGSLATKVSEDTDIKPGMRLFLLMRNPRHRVFDNNGQPASILEFDGASVPNPCGMYQKDQTQAPQPQQQATQPQPQEQTSAQETGGSEFDDQTVPDDTNPMMAFDPNSAHLPEDY